MLYRARCFLNLSHSILKQQTTHIYDMLIMVAWGVNVSRQCRTAVNGLLRAAGYTPKRTYWQPPSPSDALEGDLLCGVTRAHQHDVILRLETAKAAEAKNRKLTTSTFVVLGYASLIPLAVCNAVYARKVSLIVLQPARSWPTPLTASRAVTLFLSAVSTFEATS